MYDNTQVVDTRGITTTGLTSATTVVAMLTELGTALQGLRTPGTDQRVSAALLKLNELATLVRRLHA